MFAKYRLFVTQVGRKIMVYFLKLSFHYFTTQQYFLLLRVLLQDLTNRTNAKKIIETQKGKKKKKNIYYHIYTITNAYTIIIYYKSYDNYITITILSLQKVLKKVSQSKIQKVSRSKI